MKKVYKSHKYKRWHDRRSSKVTPRSKKYRSKQNLIRKTHRGKNIIREPIKAPENLCLLKETESCLKFFSDLRKESNVNKINGIRYIQMDLSKVTSFDYSTICVLVAIINDLKLEMIYLRSNFPENEQCRENLKKSGFLNFMQDERGRRFEKSKHSELFFIKDDGKSLKQKDIQGISDTLKKVSFKLINEERYIRQVYKVILEICSNSIEWTTKQWLFGVKYDEDKVIFTMTDLGEGILKTLNKKFQDIPKRLFNTDNVILKNAFNKKYGSKTRERNRNKGLPCIQNAHKMGFVEELTVLTNNVILHYGQGIKSEDIKSQVFKEHEFKGTFYKWIVNKTTLTKKII